MNKFVYANGSKIHYKEINAGESQPLVMLNGIGANLETWTPLLSYLEDRHIVMLDMPGVGKSPSNLFPKTMSWYANTVYKALYELGLETFDLLGYSWSGACSQEFVKLHPERVNKLILVSTTPGLEGKMPEPSVIAMASSPARHYSREIAKKVAPFIHGGNPSDEEVMFKYLRPPNPIGFSHQVAALAQWSAKKRPVNARHETLILSGNKDPLIPHRNSLVLHQKFTKSRLEIISGAGHLWVISAPHESSKLIKEFLSDEG